MRMSTRFFVHVCHLELGRAALPGPPGAALGEVFNRASGRLRRRHRKATPQRAKVGSVPSRRRKKTREQRAVGGGGSKGFNIK